jgi:hypothetical protein
MMPEHPSHRTEDELSASLDELTQEIENLPEVYRLRLAPLLERVARNTTRRRRMLQMVHEALEQLRLDMKYLVFDLEATRRERDAYRRHWR